MGSSATDVALLKRGLNNDGNMLPDLRAAGNHLASAVSRTSCRGTSRRSGRDPEVAPRELDEGMEAGSRSLLVVRLHHLRRASTSRRSRGKNGVQEW
mmetsp:Transcript_20511/g.54987  ORF Transcript_20511/g.54987 Transcript_20511/m.54987 type:complete len:97 (-) Transcript_20511:23-313(-)